ncbi:penicillin-binding protein [Bosea sp. WAO]|uniref:penicillin-binding protein 1A n=1 Tax=Bosea sp. WAO TaxID=406341 RepID=UPI00074A321C|nr:penicillin-binding protein 1A [Bosea sp. WAO]KUL94276.1 penicillin-binding protein [Bosea sp. WAO]
MRFILRSMAEIVSALSVFMLSGAAAAGIVVWSYSSDLPGFGKLQDYEPPVTSRVHAGDGRLIGEFAREWRLYLPISAVPQNVIEAYISAEDKNFYRHGGVDLAGLARAALSNLRNAGSGRRPQGASTITQQVAKNFLVGTEASLERKIRETLVALRIEGAYSKDKILELYLNSIYLGAPTPGRGSYGIAAAALNYFNKSVNELELREAAYLAALPKAPTDLHPFRNRERAIERRNYVIDRMVENGYVEREVGEEAKRQSLGVTPYAVSPNNIAAGYFVEEIRREVQDRYGEKKVVEGGLSIRATVDPELQLMARKALVDGLVRYDEPRGWRGPVRKLDLGEGDWGEVLGALKVLGDVAPWRLGVVLKIAGDSARIGLHPLLDAAGNLRAERRIVTLARDGIRWTRRARVSQLLSVGDVVYVEPLASDPARVRLRQIPEINGAIVAMEPFSGRVLAMVGGFSHDQSEFNRATQALRQPGSVFKPFVYAAALDNGYTPTSLILDEPVSIDQGGGLGVWRPKNAGRAGGSGPQTLRNGIQRSKNFMTVRLAKDIGMPLVGQYARRFGVYDDMPFVLSGALGAVETTVMRMTAAYAMLVNGGKRIRPTLIDRIQDRYGKTIFRHDRRTCPACEAARWQEQAEPRLTDHSEQVIDPLTAYQMVSILEGTVRAGTARVVHSVGKPLGGKTGTTNGAKDLWFIGFSPDLAVGVYIGHDHPAPLGASAWGSRYAAPIFRDFMSAALRDKPAVPFRIPPGTKLIRVDPLSGLRTSEGGILEAFKPGTAPADPAVPRFSEDLPAEQQDRAALTTGSGGLY